MTSLTLTPHESVTIRESTPELLEVEVTYRPGGKRPPAHEPARAIWRTRPAGRTEQWFRALDALQRSGRVDRKGMPRPLALGVLLTEYDDVIRPAARPRSAVKAALALLSLAGRARGYGREV